MTVNAIVSWVVCGLIVGLLARFLVPRRLEVGLVLTMVLGAVGAVVGGLLYSFVQGVPGEPFSLSGNAWHSWIVALIGGVVVLYAWGGVYPKKWWQ